MTNTITPEDFHAELREQFAKFEQDVREGKVEEYSFLADQGMDYNSWLEHRHGWPVLEGGRCGPCSASSCCDEHETYEVNAEDCEVCRVLMKMYDERKTEAMQE